MRSPSIVKSGQQHLLGKHPGCSFSLLAILLSWLLISCTDNQDSRRYFAVFPRVSGAGRRAENMQQETARITNAG